MDTLEQLQDKKHMLSERVSQLKNAIASAEQGYSEESILTTAREINSLETQLRLTEKALENTQDKLREQEKFLNSKEYKDKLKMQENLRKQAEKETREVLRNAYSMQTDIENISKMLSEIDKLRRETGDRSILGVAYSQPFAWLLMLRNDIEHRISDSKFIKLEV